MNKAGNIYWIVGLLILFLAVDVALATWLLTPPLSRQYVVQPGETLADIARQTRTHEQSIVSANNLRPGELLEPGQVLSIPSPPASALLDWPVQVVSILATVAGVMISFWLCRTAGLVPHAFQGRILAVASVVALAAHAAGVSAGQQLVTTVTPQLALDSVKAGFAWGACIPLLSNALGFRGDRAG